MNLTCGRNPWKRASIEDSTFRAYLKNPKFLSSILPLSPELDSILRRIFECDPRRRINIPELRSRILRCPRFTTRSAVSPPIPEPEVQDAQNSKLENIPDSINPFYLYPTVPFYPVPPPIHTITAQYSQLTISSTGSSVSDDGSVYSTSSSCSSTSSTANVNNISRPQGSIYIPPKPQLNYYGTFMPLDPTPKDLVPEQFFHSVQVC